MKLNTLRPAKGSTKTNKRLGRGQGSGRGGTSTRGEKGAKSRSGYSSKSGFEGGQMPLQRRVPKFGFKRPQKVVYKSVNLDVIQELVEKTKAKSVDIELLTSNGIIGKRDVVKILGRGELKTKVDVSAHKFSTSAIEAIEKLGGKATTL
jgi:large subunit ribosomal protein L15